MKNFIDNIPNYLPDGWYDYMIEPVGERWVIILFTLVVLWLFIASGWHNFKE